jgi:hypothetical protein
MFSFFKSRCYNGGNQHNYEPRYDTFLPVFPSIAKAFDAQELVEVINAFHASKYVQDVCVWCGKVVTRDKE